MAFTHNKISPDSLAWLAQNLHARQLIRCWRDGMTAITGLYAPPTMDQFHNAKIALLQSRMLTNLDLSSTNLANKKSRVGILLLAQLLTEQLAEIPTAQRLFTQHFNPVLALAAIMASDRKLTPTIMPAPQWLRNESFLGSRPCASGPIQQNSAPLIFTKCKANDADTLRRLIPGAHPLAMGHDKLVEGLINLPTDHWLTIVIPALRLVDALPALQSICEQSSQGMTILVIGHGQSQCTTELGEIRQRLLSNCRSELLVISALDCGPYDAMNLGIKLANTPWIYFMGVDDTLAASDALTTIKNAVSKASHKTKIIYGNVKIQGAGHGTYDNQIYAYAFDYERLQTQNPCHQAIFYRVNALRELGGYSLKYPVCADWDANIRLWRTSAPAFVDVVIAKFARGGISSTTYDYSFFGDLPLTWRQNRHNLAPADG